jgi:hypothetical protein
MEHAHERGIVQRWFVFEANHLAMSAENGRFCAAEVEIGPTLLDELPEQVVHRHARGRILADLHFRHRRRRNT